MPRLELRFLGPPSIEIDGAPVSTDRRKAVALLAYLAVTAVPHARETLAALLWPDYESASAYAYLRRTLWEIKQMVGEAFLDAGRQQVSLPERPELWTDVAAFRTYLEEGRDGDIVALQAAIDLYRDDFLAGFSLQDTAAFDEWQTFQAETLRGALGGAHQQAALLFEQAGEIEKAMEQAVQWLGLDQLHEPAQRLVMHLQAASGRRAAALRQYEAFVARLQAEFGARPEPETTDLYDRIRLGELAASPVATVQTRPPPVPAPIPAQLTSFVGRERELAEIAALLADPDCRLLTLAGPGGMGKTRLALAAAARVAVAFPDGVFFVPLAALTSADQIVSAVAKALDFSFFGNEAEPVRQLLDYLQRRRLLLLLDNYEHLLYEGSEDVFPSLALTTARQLKILVTSRVRLRLQGEYLFEVSGLHIPEPGENSGELGAYSAVQLFLQSARRLQPGFTLDPENAPAIAGICRAVEGMPLALELAAGWIGLLSAREILAEIQNGLDLLTSDLADIPDRQRSIRAVFDATWKRLTPAEQSAFPALALFRGDFSREAAQFVAGASLQTLQSLLGKSLLRRNDDGRFDLHELLRQYALAHLRADMDHWQHTRSRYIDHYLGLLRRQGVIMRGPDQRRAYDTLAAEREHVREAWLWAIADGRLGEANASVSDLFRYYLAREIRPEIGAIASAGLDLVDAGSDDEEERLLYLHLLILRAWSGAWIWTSPQSLQDAHQAYAYQAAWNLGHRLGLMQAVLGAVLDLRGENEKGAELLERCVAQARANRDDFTLAWTLNLLSEHHLWGGNIELARQLLQESIAIAKENGDHLLLAHDLLSLGSLETQAQNYEAASEVLAESERGFEAIGDRASVAEVMYQSGISSQRIGAYEDSIRYFLAGLKIVQDLGDDRRAADMVSWASIAARDWGRYELAWRYRREAQSMYEALDDEHGVAWSLWEAAELSLRNGQLEEARRYVEQALALFQAHDNPRGLCFCQRTLGDLAAAAADAESAARHYQRSLQFARDEQYGWGQAFALNRLGQLALRQDRLQEAEHSLMQGLRHAAAWPDRSLSLMAIQGLAEIEAQRERPATAAQFTALVLKQPAAWPETNKQAGDLLARLATALPAGVLAESQARGESSRLTEIITALIAEASEPL